MGSASPYEITVIPDETALNATAITWKKTPVKGRRVSHQPDGVPGSTSIHAKMPVYGRYPFACWGHQQMLVRSVLLAAIVAVRNPNQRARLGSSRIHRLEAPPRSLGSPAPACRATFAYCERSGRPTGAWDRSGLRASFTQAFSMRTSGNRWPSNSRLHEVRVCDGLFFGSPIPCREAVGIYFHKRVRGVDAAIHLHHAIL